MKTHLAIVLLISLSAQGAFAQNTQDTQDDPPARPAAKPRYVVPYVNQRSQIDAMVPRPDDVTEAYGPNSNVSPSANSRYVLPPVHAKPQYSSGKATHGRVAPPARAAAAENASDTYGSNQWNVGQTYADPNLSNPYSAP
jgi:hypothetical protein